MNVVLIVSDTFRWDHLGCYGNEWIRTPNIDRLAEKSVVFDRAYCGSFPTIPNRAELFTGRFVFTYFEWSPLPPNEVVISQVLGNAGYTTMMIADTPHILQHGFYFDRGFTGWKQIRGQENDRYITDPIEIKYPCDPRKLRSPEISMVRYLRNVSIRRGESDYFVAQTMTEAAKWLEKNHKQDKFFLYVDTFDPHEPWDPPQWYVDLYDPSYEGEEVIYPLYAPPKFLTKEELKHVRALYAGEVTLVDKWVGVLLQRIEELGLLDNTAIIFTSDHGFCHGEHNLLGKLIIRGELGTQEGGLGMIEAAPLYEEICHIPLIIRLPDEEGGRRCDALVQPADIMPTILELTGVKDPGTMHGKSLMPLINREKESLRNCAVSSWSLIFGPRTWRPATITTKEWALIYGGKVGLEGSRVGTESQPITVSAVDGLVRRVIEAEEVRKENELYHLPSDPKQEKNVLTKNMDVAKRLHAEYFNFLKSVNTPEECLEGRLEF